MKFETDVANLTSKVSTILIFKDDRQTLPVVVSEKVKQPKTTFRKTFITGIILIILFAIGTVGYFNMTDQSARTMSIVTKTEEQIVQVKEKIQTERHPLNIKEETWAMSQIDNAFANNNPYSPKLGGSTHQKTLNHLVLEGSLEVGEVSQKVTPTQNFRDVVQETVNGIKAQSIKIGNISQED